MTEQKVRERVFEILAKLTTEARCIEAGIQKDNEPELVEQGFNEILTSFKEVIEGLKPMKVTAYAKWMGRYTEIITIDVATKLCQKVAQAQLDDIKRQLFEKLEG